MDVTGYELWRVRDVERSQQLRHNRSEASLNAVAGIPSSDEMVMSFGAAGQSLSGFAARTNGLISLGMSIEVPQGERASGSLRRWRYRRKGKYLETDVCFIASRATSGLSVHKSRYAC